MFEMKVVEMIARPPYDTRTGLSSLLLVVVVVVVALVLLLLCIYIYIYIHTYTYIYICIQQTEWVAEAKPREITSWLVATRAGLESGYAQSPY